MLTEMQCMALLSAMVHEPFTAVVSVPECLKDSFRYSVIMFGAVELRKRSFGDDLYAHAIRLYTNVV